jgi:hypothetical protein
MATVDGERKELPCVRPAKTPPPCRQCPKESPEKAHEHELSEKNWRAYAHYQQMRAVGPTSEERADPIVRRNAAIIDQVVRQQEAKQAAQMTAGELAKVIMASKGG